MLKILGQLQLYYTGTDPELIKWVAGLGFKLVVLACSCYGSGGIPPALVLLRYIEFGSSFDEKLWSCKSLWCMGGYS